MKHAVLSYPLKVFWFFFFNFKEVYLGTCLYALPSDKKAEVIMHLSELSRNLFIFPNSSPREK